MRVSRVIPFVLVALGGLGTFSSAALAAVEGPGWQLFADTYPTNLIPSKASGETSGTIGIEVFNVGAGTSSGPITVTDTLPPGVKAKQAGQLIRMTSFLSTAFGIEPEIERGSWPCTGNGPSPYPSVAGASVVTCVDEEQPFAGGGGLPTFLSSSLAENYNPQPAVGITVEAGAQASGLTNRVAIAGGGALEPAATTDPVTISSNPAKGGVVHADAWFSNADGTVDRGAGSHPYTATFVFDAATALNAEKEPYFPGAEIRDLETVVPPGFIGDLHAVPQCSREQLLGEVCPPSSMVGLLKSVTVTPTVQKQVFNMVPPPGIPAELGYNYVGIPVYITFKVRTGGDNAIVARVNNIPQNNIVQNVLTLWGVPAEASHDRMRRGHEGGCSQQEMVSIPPPGGVNYCELQPGPIVTPFLTLPTSCGEPEARGFAFRELAGWQDAGAESEVAFPVHDAQGQPAGFTGCESLLFEPAITTSPDTGKADTPTGLTVEVKPPLGGLDEPTGESSADIEDTVMALPPGLVINPGQAAGLQACRPGDVEGGDNLPLPGENGDEERFEGPAKCPNASKVGTVVIKSPLIEGSQEKQFEGDVYVLQSNPPELKLLVAASADGINLKLVGEAHLCESVGEVIEGAGSLATRTCQAPGQLITTFQGTPQLPFTLFRLSFSGGAQAALDTPTQCGTYTSEADFTPWSSPFVSDFFTNAQFQLTEGPNDTVAGGGSGGSSCPSSPLPFTPELVAGSTTDQAGGFTSFSLLLQRGDGQQRIERLQFKAPAGLGGMLSTVPLCPEPQAAQGTCSSASQIGHATVDSGPGPYPLVIPQPGEPESPIYLTGGYGGAPFGLTIVTHVLAGPFNLGTIVTRARIEIDPHTAQITVTTDPLPQVVAGVPTDLRLVDAVIDRSGFMFNPTNCTPSSFSGTASGAAPAGGTLPGGTQSSGAGSGTTEAGQSAPISSHFGVGSCKELAFEPKFSVSTSGKTSKTDGASLTTKVTYPNVPQGTDADIGYVKVELPKQLPSRLTTLQKACTAAQFEANPAGCPSASFIGHAVVHTPELPVALEGPAIFVSHGGEAFPSLTLVLQGDGVTINLVGTTFISKSGITSTTFKTVPDAPFSSFELTLPEGPYSALAANGNLCTSKLVMPNEFVGQNGAVIKRNNDIVVEGCKPAIYVVSHKVKGNTATIEVKVPSAGKLTASGKGLIAASGASKATRSTSSASGATLTVKLSLTKAELATLKKHKGRKLRAKIKLSFAPKKGGRLKTSVTVLVG